MTNQTPPNPPIRRIVTGHDSNLNAIVRIDEVLESGEAKIKKNKSDISPFPINIQPQSKKD